MSLSTKAPRNSAIELLRVIAMLTIVLSHACIHSEYDFQFSPLSLNRLFVQFGYLGNLGVVIFLLISGYCQYGSTFRTASLSRLLGQVWFYSITINLLFVFFDGYQWVSPLLVFFPTLYEEYWFFTAYLVLYLLSPFLNKLAQALDRQQFSTMLWCMAVLWVLIPTVTRQQMYAAQFPQFLLYYLTGVWFRKYPDNCFRSSLLRWCTAIVPLATLYLLTAVLGYLERYTPEAFCASFRFYDRNSAFIAGSALGMFLVAIYHKPFVNRFLNVLGSCTFGVYLIHETPPLRDFLWRNHLNHELYFTSGSFIPRVLLSVLLVYVVCTSIEWGRQKTVAKPIERIIDKVLSRLLKKGSFV